MNFDTAIARILAQFGYQDIDQNALELLRQMTDNYIASCCKLQEKTSESLIKYGMTYAGNSCSNLIKYTGKFDCLSGLNQQE